MQKKSRQVFGSAYRRTIKQDSFLFYVKANFCRAASETLKTVSLTGGPDVSFLPPLSSLLPSAFFSL